MTEASAQARSDEDPERFHAREALEEARRGLELATAAAASLRCVIGRLEAALEVD